MSAVGVPLGATVAELIRNEIESRKQIASEILIEEVKRGSAESVDEAAIHEAIPMLIRYARAAAEGSARLNLRLLGQVIAGQVVTRDWTADQFLYHADIVASLRRNEIILLGKLHYHIHNLRTEFGGEANLNLIDVWEQLQGDLVPEVFPARADMIAAATALSRTGLLILKSGWGTGGQWTTSPLMEELASQISIEAAFASEDVI